MLVKNRNGQAILEYILLVIMLAVTMAVVIRNTNQTIYRYWTGLAHIVSMGCVDCSSPVPPPDIRNGTVN